MLSACWLLLRSPRLPLVPAVAPRASAVPFSNVLSHRPAKPAGTTSLSARALIPEPGHAHTPRERDDSFQKDKKRTTFECVFPNPRLHTKPCLLTAAQPAQLLTPFLSFWILHSLKKFCFLFFCVMMSGPRRRKDTAPSSCPGYIQSCPTLAAERHHFK